MLELAADLGHSLANEPPVGLDLGFTGTSEETKAAALPLEVSPAPDEPACLVIEVSEFNLKPTFGGCSALAENLKDEPRPVDHLGPDLVLQILLLDRTERRIDDEEGRPLLAREPGDFLHLPLPQKRRRPDRSNSKWPRRNDVDADRFGKPDRFIDPGFGRSP
jgi:hypothetical protein